MPSLTHFSAEVSTVAPAPWYWDRPVLWWGEMSGPLHDLATGRMVLNRLTVTLTSTPRTVQRHLFVSSGEVDSAVWASLLIFAILLFDVYVIALEKR